MDILSTFAICKSLILWTIVIFISYKRLRRGYLVQVSVADFKQIADIIVDLL